MNQTTIISVRLYINMAPRKTKRTNRIRKNKNKTKKTQKRIRFLLQKGGSGTIGPASYIPFETTPGQYIPPPYAPTIGATADPSDPSNVVSVRMQPNVVGGKRKSGRKTRKLRGGADTITDAQTSSIPYSFLTTAGAQTSANVIQAHSIPELNASNSQAFRTAVFV